MVLLLIYDIKQLKDSKNILNLYTNSDIHKKIYILAN